jgi:CobQ-like glutamine amidotransferase family enzyme
MLDRTFDEIHGGDGGAVMTRFATRTAEPVLGTGEPRRLRIVHLFPDLLSVYGDTGNLRALVVRAERRGIVATVERVLADTAVVPEADVFLIGGGQDRDQLAVERALSRLDSAIVRQLDDGASLLAVCGGYQNLGQWYRFADGRTVHGPGIFAAHTRAGDTRLVGRVVAHLAPTDPDMRGTVVGFENHSGRTELDPGAHPLATIEIGYGNNGHDQGEGILAIADRGPRKAALCIGTYLHGPLLPLNPHIADTLLRAGLSRTGQPAGLAAIDDTEEWRAHDHFLSLARNRSWFDHLPSRLRLRAQRAQGLIGF